MISYDQACLPKTDNSSMSRLIVGCMSAAGAIRMTPVTLEHSALDTIQRFNKGVHFTEVGTAAGDMWSLGVLLYETATGHVPFPLTYPPHKGYVLADLMSMDNLLIEASAHQAKWQVSA